MAQQCKFFLQGRCAKGATCHFIHDQDKAAPTWPAAMHRTANRPPQAPLSAPCSFFLQGRCRHGEDCTFSHAVELSPDLTETPPAPASTSAGPSPRNDIRNANFDTRSTVPCIFFVRGNCSKGSDCVFQHSSQVQENALDDDDPQPTQQESDVEMSRRAIGGALVQFKDGASVSNISLIGDLSAACLSGLSRQSTVQSIAALLSGLGFDVQEDAIQISNPPNSDFCRAFVTGSTPDFAKLLCHEIRMSKGDQTAGLTAVSIPPRLPSGSASRRINCRKVLVSWHNTNRLVWMNFGTEGIARRVSEKFNSGRYKIAGIKVTAGEPQGGDTRITRGGRRANPVSWTVMVKGVPSNASEGAISAAVIDSYDKPRHIELDRAASSTDGAMIPTLVESLLSSIGPLDFMTEPQLRGSKFKAIAQFSDDFDARRAVDKLHNERQHCLEGGRLFLQLRTSSKLKVSSKILEAVETQLLPHTTAWKAQRLTFKTYPDPANRLTSITIEGEDQKEVAKAANALEVILRGRMIQDGDQPLWFEALANHNMTPDLLHSLHGKDGVLILRNRRKKHLTYFGPEEAYAEVQDSLRNRLEQMSLRSQEHLALALDEKQFVWACRGGFNKLTESLGPGIASMDVASNPKRILISGPQDKYRQAQEFILRGGQASPTMPLETDDQLCAICWTEPENPVCTGCKHHYCLDCFEGLCTSADASGAEFKVICQGDMGKCEATLGLRDMSELLPSAAFEDVLETSFTSHVNRRPNEFRYCPSPDCGFIYRVTETPALHTCLKCLEVVCTTCHHQHGTISCAEYTDISSGGREAFEKFKKEMNIKDCPKCKTPMEKTSGCNHMTCGGCRAHICWVCMAVFDAGGPVYEHMRMKHGGIGL